MKAIIGLGNPGRRFDDTRHNIGFAVVDDLAEKYYGSWNSKNNYLQSKIIINEQPILLVKPQTFMNNSGEVMPYLAKQGIDENNILVVHDELEKPFGTVAVKEGGSHRGHNGLRSLFNYIGKEFSRLRCGIGRPANKEDVPDYVLEKFNASEHEIKKFIDDAVQEIEKVLE